MITCKQIYIDKEHIVFKLSNGSEYDPHLKDVITPPWSNLSNQLWLHHMQEKNWFTKDVEEKTKKILADYLPDES